MGNVTLYIQARRNVEAQEDEVLLGDAASIYCEDSAIRAKANAMRIHKFHEGRGWKCYQYDGVENWPDVTWNYSGEHW